MKLNALPDLTAALTALHSAGLSSIVEVLLLLEILRAQQVGEKHTLSTLTAALDIPLSTASRAVWTLVDRHRLVIQLANKTDRRIKILEVDTAVLRRMARGA